MNRCHFAKPIVLLAMLLSRSLPASSCCFSAQRARKIPQKLRIHQCASALICRVSGRN
jgi:hypothetical protein